MFAFYIQKKTFQMISITIEVMVLLLDQKDNQCYQPTLLFMAHSNRLKVRSR